MPRNPVQLRSKEKKRKLVVAGMKLFSEKGFHETGITQLAKQAGVSVGSFYSYFDDKEDLLRQVTQSYATSIMRGVYGGMSDDAPYAEGANALVWFIVNRARQAHALSTELHREMLALKNRDPHMAELDRKIVQTFENEIEIILTRSEIKTENIGPSARLVSGAIEETMHRCLIEKQEPEMEKTFQELVEMCAGYLFRSK